MNQTIAQAVLRSAPQAADQGGLFGGGSLGTVLLIVGMVLAVAVVSGLGFIARMNDRSAERKAARRSAEEPAPGAGPAGGGPAGGGPTGDRPG